MTDRVYNFYSGPAMLPTAVLEQARDELLSYRGTGMSVMEMSHRSDIFLSILHSARSRIRRLLSIPENYHVLFLQGGASLQFSMLPMNFLAEGTSADYIITGTWSDKAGVRAEEFGTVNRIDAAVNGTYTRVPARDELQFSADARYIHYASNETIHGVEFPYDVDGRGVPVVCDASSNILSRPLEIEKYSMIYAGAQKNIGPSGVTLVIIRDDFLQTATDSVKGVLSYRSFAENDSMPNTPNTWGIYLMDLVCKWLEDAGGVAAMAVVNTRKAEALYRFIDASDGFYRGSVERGSRSRMNVTFRLPSAELEDRFCKSAAAFGLVGLKGHRSVGGIRASMYNAFPEKGVARLVEFMDEFARENG